MRTGLLTRLNFLEADRADKLVTVHPLDAFYGVPGARPSRMEQGAFRARAARGLAGFYADACRPPGTPEPDFPPLQAALEAAPDSGPEATTSPNLASDLAPAIDLAARSILALRPTESDAETLIEQHADQITTAHPDADHIEIYNAIADRIEAISETHQP